MGNTEFDKIVSRKGSGALKYDALKERYGNPDLLPLWVADMDFDTPDFIVEALRKRLEHPIFGYTVIPDKLWESIIAWNKKLHNWEIKREWLSFIPGIVKGIGMVINVFTSPGDKIIIQPPVYHPFRLVPEGNGRDIVANPLILQSDGSYKMDFDNLKRLAEKDDVKLLILSNPHNPAGIVWDAATLRELALICRSNGILVVSDEIHSDMALWDNRHIPFASVSDDASKCSITFAAPSKTFNIAGIVSSYSVIIEENIRKKFYSWIDANEFSEPTVFAPIATIAAYTEGYEWRCSMLRYVEGNIDYIIGFCKDRLQVIRPLRPQASFLVWLDCREMGFGQKELVDFFVKECKLALNDGSMFGRGGEGFMRLNVGTSRQTLEDAMSRIERVWKKRKS